MRYRMKNSLLSFFQIFTSTGNIKSIFLYIIFKLFMIFCFIQTDTVVVAATFYHHHHHHNHHQQQQQNQQHSSHNIRKISAKINDPIFGARCDTKCWNHPANEKLQCRTECLQEPWQKPGLCSAQNETVVASAVPSLERGCINSCRIDSECVGLLKCCEHSCGITCQTPIALDSVSGVPPTPENVTVDISNEDHQDDIEIIVRWTNPVIIVDVSNTTTDAAEAKILYLIEERHHIGKQFTEERLSDWVIRRRSSATRNKVSIKNLYKAGRWYLFRVTAINENGTRGPSQPSKPFFSTTTAPKVPNMPLDLRIGATSWGNGKLHLLLTWKEPASDLPIYRYKVTSSRLRNFTLIQHHHTLPASTTYFWLKDSAPNTEYFLQVQAFSIYGKRKLAGDIGSIVFNTANHKHVEKSSTMSDIKRISRHNKMKYKRRLRDLRIEKLYWLRDQLLAKIVWTAIKKPKINYFVTWFHNGCQHNSKAWYIAKTDMTYFEVYDLQPACRYTISVKSVWRQTLFVEKLTLDTINCTSHNATVTNNIIFECPLPVIL